MSSNQPSILVLMTDQHRFDAMGCAGNAKIRTPNLDALAASGIRFDQAVTPTPVCVAARMSFITGHRVARTHWVSNSALPGPVPELPSMMSLLSRAGYTWVADRSVDFLREHTRYRNDQPFFLEFVDFSAPAFCAL